MSGFELPDDVLNIISEYSKPLTRGNWRTCGKMNHLTFHTELKKYTTYEHFLFYTSSMYTIQIKHLRFWLITTRYRDKNNYIEDTCLLFI
jgi:hypothetical protein